MSSCDESLTKASCHETTTHAMKHSLEEQLTWHINTQKNSTVRSVFELSALGETWNRCTGARLCDGHALIGTTPAHSTRWWPTTGHVRANYCVETNSKDEDPVVVVAAVWTMKVFCAQQPKLENEACTKSHNAVISVNCSKTKSTQMQNRAYQKTPLFAAMHLQIMCTYSQRVTMDKL